jgi:hypothetical protein
MQEGQAPAPEGGGIEELLAQTDSQLGAVAEAVSPAGLPPEIAEKFMQAQAMFADAIASLQGGGSEPQAEGPQGARSPEQGGSGARPMGA